MFTRMLVAASQRPGSDPVLTYAADLATDMGAELRLLTVSSSLMSRPIVDGREPFAPLTDDTAYSGPAGLGLATAHATIVETLQTTWRTWGDVPEQIVQTTSAEDCDLIVMDDRLLRGPKRWLRGDALKIVTAKAQQPILVVNQPPPPRLDRPLWRRLLVATSGPPESDVAVDYGLTLAWLQELELCVLHIDCARPETDADCDAIGGHLLTHTEVRAAALGLTYDGVHTAGDIVSDIVATAKRNQCDVIVLGSHGTSGWKRTMVSRIAHAVATRATRPVLLVKRPMRL